MQRDLEPLDSGLRPDGRPRFRQGLFSRAQEGAQIRRLARLQRNVEQRTHAAAHTIGLDVQALADHPQFTLKNPNRVRALYMAFAVNPAAFHAVDGTGYRMIADLILALDPLNPQTAARFVAPLGRWRRIEPVRSALMRAELERLAAAGNLSRDTAEQVARSLG